MKLTPIFIGLAAAQTPLTFDPREASIDSVKTAIFSGTASCRDIVSSYIARIERYNPVINAIITLNPNALDIADELDQQFLASNLTTVSSRLFCVPVVLKDNYDTMDMPTTGGCADLAGMQPSTDTPSVAALRAAGAVILAKANLHELALEGISVSSLGGQTLNPYDQTRTPGGSSGGTGASIAASFAVFGTGTDTVNSLRSPASANSLVSVRPTRGLISRAGVIPISYTQDAIGPIARSVEDAATALTVMASVGYDSNDNATALIPDDVVGLDYASALIGGSLRGLRLGVLDTFFNRTSSNETTPVNQAMDSLVSKLALAGVEIVHINETVYNSAQISATLDVQTSEYRELLTGYLQDPSLKGDSHPKSFEELYASGKFLVIPSQYSYVNTAAVSSTSNASYIEKLRGIDQLKVAIESTFKKNSLDAFIYPEQMNLVVKTGSPSQSGRNGIMAALAGNPVVTVQAGFSPASDDAPLGVPVGMEIMGLPWTEQKLLNIAARIADIHHVRRVPRVVLEPVVVPEYEQVPKIVPNVGNISPNYPLGTL